MKRKRQLRELMSELEKDEAAPSASLFDTKQIEPNWADAFNLKTPSISRRRHETLETSVLVGEMVGSEAQNASFEFEELDEKERDRIIVEAEKDRKKVKTTKPKGLPQAKRTISDIEQCGKGTVSGYINDGKVFGWMAPVDGVPIVRVNNRENSIADLDDQLNESLHSDSDSLL